MSSLKNKSEHTNKPTHKLNSFSSYDRSMTIMALPGILFFIAFNYLPLFGTVLAFKDYNYKDGILFSPWVGFKNFEFFFTSDLASRITYNTLVLNGVFIVTAMVLQIAFAILLSELKNKTFVKISNSLMFFPFFVSWVVVGYFTYALFSMNNGMLNSLLHMLGMPEVEWYNEAKYWPTILTFANLWKNVGYGSVIYYAAITSISNEYYEAAEIDGAGRWKKITHITIPMIKPLIIILFLLALGKIFRSDFGMFYNLTRNSGMLYRTTDVMDTFVFRSLRVSGDIGLASAAGLYQSVVGFLLVIFSNKLVKRIDEENALF